jgi:hypothetical protein
MRPPAARAPLGRAAVRITLSIVAVVLAALSLAACSSSDSVVPAGTVTPGPLESNGPISWSEASSRMGEELTVQGPVTSTGDDGAGGVVLNVGAPESDPSRFVVVIPKEALAEFPADPATYYDGQLVTVTGLIEDRAGTATMTVTSREDIKTGL